MARLLVKGWADFQHYKDRAPPWIKLHKTLLDNFEFQRLPVASRALAPMLWLLASEQTDGAIEFDTAKIAFRLRQSVAEFEDAVKPLIHEGFFILERDASKPLAEHKRGAMPETETEVDTEKEKEKEKEREEEADWAPRNAPPRSAPAPRPTRKPPADFVVSDELKAWALEKGYALAVVEETEKFKDHTFKTAITDWPGAWRNWMRNAAGRFGGMPAASGAMSESGAGTLRNAAGAKARLKQMQERRDGH